MTTIAENNELITSTDVERLVTLRKQLIDRAEAATSELLSIQREMTQYYTHFGFNNSSRDGVEIRSNPMPDITKNIDKAMWGYLMEKTQMFSVMDHATKAKFRKDLENPPALTVESVAATFAELLNSRDDIFEQGIINLFKNLSWDYKTNQPQKFGKRIVKTFFCRPNYSKGMAVNYGRASDELVDLERIMLSIDKKPQPEHSKTLPYRIDSYSQQTGEKSYQDDYVSVKMFKNQNMHIEFKRPDIIEQMNFVIARNYPGALPAPK